MHLNSFLRLLVEFVSGSIWNYIEQEDNVALALSRPVEFSNVDVNLYMYEKPYVSWILNNVLFH